MRALLTFFLSTILASTSFAEITIVNKSKYDMDVGYKFCKDIYKPHYNRECSPLNMATIKNLQDPKHYYVTAPPNDSTVIIITSSVEKDDHENVVAHGNYVFGQGSEGRSSDCGMYLVTHDRFGKEIKKNVVISLDDLGQTPVIMCQAATY